MPHNFSKCDKHPKSKIEVRHEHTWQAYITGSLYTCNIMEKLSKMILRGIIPWCQRSENQCCSMLDKGFKGHISAIT